MAKKTDTNSRTTAEKRADVDELVKSPRNKPRKKSAPEVGTTQDSLKKTRSNRANRGEVRRQTVSRKGHPK